MLFDNNLIAYEYFKNQYTPKAVYPSGEREEANLINEYGKNFKENCVLVIEKDIINSEGLGLKQGFYNIKPDKYLDFLLLYQEGKLKAKVPVLKTEVFSQNNSQKQKKPKKMSLSKYQKQQEKEYRKYLKGINPSEIEWSEAEIFYNKEKEAYLLIYRSNNLELTGVIKL